MRRKYTLGGYTEWGPNRDASACVEAFWTFRTDVPVVHRVLPHAGVTLALETSRTPDGLGAAELVLMGPASRHRFFRPGPDAEVVAVRLHPEWTEPLLGIDPGDVVDRIEPVGDRARWRAVRDGLVAAERTAGRLRLLATLVAERIERSRDGCSPLAMRLLRQLRSAPDRPSRLFEIASREQVSERTVRRVVRRATGLSPKRLHRLERLNRTIRAADAAERPTWGALAPAHGYADQAHFIREVRDLAGCTPGELHRERRAECCHGVGQPPSARTAR